MEEFFKAIWESSFCDKYSPYVVIALLFIMFLFVKNQLKELSSELFIKVLGLIIGVIIFYCIVWYMDKLVVEI